MIGIANCIELAPICGSHCLPIAIGFEKQLDLRLHFGLHQQSGYSTVANQTYAQLQKQIAALEVQAAKLKVDEVAGVVGKIKEAIAVYGLTAQDLFGAKTSAVAVKTTTKKAEKSASAKFADGKGGEWVGRGPRPQWLRDALAGGKSLQDFAVGSMKATAAPATPEAPAAAAAPKKTRAKGKAAKKAKQPKAAKYADGTGNTWTGMGRKPRWFVDALGAGKTLDDLSPKA